MVRIGSKWVYPEDEITDGGTWEHKKRAEEMKKTAGKIKGRIEFIVSTFKAKY